MLTTQNYAGKGTFAPLPERTAKNRPFINLLAQDRKPASTSPKAEWHTADDQAPAAPLPLTPFQAALLFIHHKQHTKPKAAAYAAFFADGQLMALEWLHNQRGHNPAINVDRVVRRAKHHRATHILLATWVRSTSEHPYAVEFWEEVDWQYQHLADNGLTLVDNLRLSETGMYSYYGDHNGPYSHIPAHFDKSVNRYYR